MNRTEATLEELLGLLPDLDELEILRLRLVSAAVPDPGKEWDGSQAFVTIDKRIVTPEGAERALAEAEEALRGFIGALHQGLRPVLDSFFAQEPEQAAQHLVALGELVEQTGRAQAARRCYAAALSVSLPLSAKAAQILALRRIGRVSVNVGDFEEAAAYYERSAELARDVQDLPGEVIALTGVGNVRLWQGRWSEAERSYHAALSLADGAAAGTLALERGQIYNNLGNLGTRQRRLDEAEAWFESAFRLWKDVSSPYDLGVCYINHTHLREVQDRWDEARESYEAALALPIPPSLRAAITTDLAEWCLREGHLTQAEEWGRISEEHAIAAGSPYTLGRMYQGRGNVARARGDADGFAFYEKALQIARDKGYLYLEGETLMDYAPLRAQISGVEEAAAYLERARDLFRELGALGELEKAERALAALSGAVPLPLVEEPALAGGAEPEPPLAATGG